MGVNRTVKPCKKQLEKNPQNKTAQTEHLQTKLCKLKTWKRLCKPLTNRQAQSYPKSPHQQVIRIFDTRAGRVQLVTRALSIPGAGSAKRARTTQPNQQPVIIDIVRINPWQVRVFQSFELGISWN